MKITTAALVASADERLHIATSVRPIADQQANIQRGVLCRLSIRGHAAVVVLVVCRGGQLIQLLKECGRAGMVVCIHVIIIVVILNLNPQILLHVCLFVL